MPTKVELQARIEKLRDERDALEAERDAIGDELVYCREAHDALRTDVTTLEAALAACQAKLAECESEPPPPLPGPEPGPGATGVILPDGRELEVAPPIGPLTEVPGNGTAPYGFQLDSQVELAGRTYEKVHAHDHTRENVSAMQWASQPGAAPVDPPLVLRDLLLERAGLGTSLNGTSAFNLRVGCTAHVSRVECHEAGWSNVWVGGRYNPLGGGGGCFHSLIEDLRCVARPNSSASMYVEHDTIGTEFRRLWIEHSTGVGFKVEWWYGSDANGNRVALAPNMHGSWGCSIEDFCFKVPATKYAITLDYGTNQFSFRNGIIPTGTIELPTWVIDPETLKRWNRKDAPELDNTVEGVTRPDGTPVPVVYHNRGAP